MTAGLGPTHWRLLIQLESRIVGGAEFGLHKSGVDFQTLADGDCVGVLQDLAGAKLAEFVPRHGLRVRILDAGWRTAHALRRHLGTGGALDSFVDADYMIDPPHSDEARFDCDWRGSDVALNGAEMMRIGGNLGRDARERLQPGWTVKRGRLRLSIWLSRSAVVEGAAS